MVTHKTQSGTFEMINLFLANGEIDPREVIECIPIVLVKGSQQELYIATIRRDSQPSKVIDAISGPVRVQIQVIEPVPLKDLEKAFAQPFVGASWSPYAVALNEQDALPASMTALIIKCRPTRKVTRRILKITATWLVRVVVAVAIGSAHNTIFG